MKNWKEMNENKSIRSMLWFIVFLFTMLLNNTALGKTPKECVDLFDRKIKHLKGKPECLSSCLAVTVDMGTFLCTSTNSYCQEYCTPCKDPILIHFDGKNLKIIRNCSKVLGAWKAVSGGANGSEVIFPWTKIQGGPVPKGRCFINPKEITEPSLKRPIFFFSQASWGKFRVPLHPEKEMNVFGRGGFFIHGGREYGSAGCIDLDDHELPFFTWLKKQTGIIPVEIKYE
ncbi:MAG: hypothetical protein HYS98_02960 [Deltaproteobacteria bacterium]|nr:hypothetical protein [Deltaproteobacteria bacterium]